MPDNSWDQARLFYLILLLMLVASFFLFGPRQRLSKSARDFAIWVLIFAMVVIAYGFRDVLRASLFPQSALEVAGGALELRRAPDGHFHARAEVNGAPVRFIVDTGASEVVLSRQDATRAGIDVGSLSFTGRARTANGLVATAPVRLDSLVFGGLVDRNLRAQVNAGELDASLLGMSYLDRFASIEIAGDRMLLRR